MSNPNQPTPHGPNPSDPGQPQPQHGQPAYGQPVYGQPQYAPDPEPKKRSWFARHKISTAVLAIAGIAVVGAALGGGDDDATPAPPSPTVAAGAPTDAGSPDVSQEAGEPAPAEEAPAGEAVAGIGENVEVGDFAITVTGVEAAIQRVGSEMFGEDPQGQFVTVALTVTNNGNSAEYFFD
nr:DUF4352 domain-containing protein [Actinomycetales bacterium]